MTPSKDCYSFIQEFEGYSETAYQDSVKVWTIGYGTIKYPNGISVKEGDVCTKEEAEVYLEHEINAKAKGVDTAIKETPLNQGQYDALVSFTYNLGIGALQSSTLLKKILKNPHDSTIYAYQTEKNKPIPDTCEFVKWVRGGGQILNGLVRRRAAEADLYSGKI